VHAGARPIGDCYATGFERRRGRQPGRLENLLFIECFPCEQRFGQSVKLLAVGAQQSLGLLVTFTDDAVYFGVDDSRRLLAERLLAPVADIRKVLRRFDQIAWMVIFKPT